MERTRERWIRNLPSGPGLISSAHSSRKSIPGPSIFRVSSTRPAASAGGGGNEGTTRRTMAAASSWTSSNWRIQGARLSHNPEIGQGLNSTPPGSQK
ncbi:MAG: hypothetical protein A2Y56_12915 [Candidatus Aminicenantes bacterium RBG_13_63_10]|nr:MAG: hypothetical protein A2Y56_12915 [Candidatus Aminicenantes bacterium RBG_13_63_10]